VGAPDRRPAAWRLRYGRSELQLLIPEVNVAGFHHPRDLRPPSISGSGGASRSRTILAAALGAATPLDALIAGKRVSLLVSDATREEPRAPVLEAVAGLLRAAGEVRLAVAVGSHDPRSPATLLLASEVESLLRKAGVHISRTILSDPFRGPFEDQGVTSRGTPVRVNAEAVDADLFVVISDMKPHYFAGYSCPPKFVFPGCASIEAIEANHALTLDPASRTGRHPWHPDPARRDNPLAEDYCEAFEIATAGRPAFALAFGSSGGEILWAEAGPLRDATARGILRVDEACGVVVDPSRHAVVSPGGYPNDVDLYIAQRALELTSAAFVEGGELLFLCACEGGIGPPHSLAAFWEPLLGDRRAAASHVPSPYRLYSHKSIRFARMILRLRAIHLHSTLPAADVRAAGLSPVADPQSVVDRWLREDPEAHILLFEGANKLSVTRR